MHDVPRDDAPPAAADLVEVLLDRLQPVADASGTSGPRMEALRILRARRARRERARRDAAELDPELAALFGLVAAEPAALGDLTPEVTAYVERATAHGLPREDLPAVFQAYVRGAGRIVAAEAATMRRIIAATAPEERATVVGDLLDGLLPIAQRGFDLLHRVLLLEALADALAGVEEPDADADWMAVAMVDLVGSTQYLAGAATAELERLVDALFEAGQGATAQRAAHVVKYVGDGLFLAGRDVEDVAAAALDVLARLEEALPLRARGGLAAGKVVQRAGDLFGSPINVAHITSKASKPGMLLATAEAAALLPANRRGRYRTVRSPHPALGDARVATVRPGQSS